MKTAIVTFVRAYNHGAVLQCYALQNKLDCMGMDNEVLDYYPRYFHDVYSLAYLGKLRYFPARPIKSWMKFVPMLAVRDLRLRGFERFIDNHIRLSKVKYNCKEDLEKEDLPYDAYIVGSDQVWCDKWTEFDPVFYLDFDARKKIKKLSYAASFGYSILPKNLEKEYRRRLTGWDLYSVREKSGVGLIKDLTGQKAVHCCDPTILLTGDEWRKIARKPPICPKNYVLVYYVNNTIDKLMQTAKEFASNRNLQIISVTSIASYDDLMGNATKRWGGKHFGACSPDVFVYLVDHAEYIITDSFHGTVFSLLLHKKFVVFGQDNNKILNTRAMELLDVVHEKRRGTLDTDVLAQGLCWDQIEEDIGEYRRDSIKYLEELVSICKESVMK